MAHPPASQVTREELEQIPAGTELLRNIRFMPAEAFIGITDAELENAARWLKAAAHSAREGARHIEALLATRQGGKP